MSHISEAGGGVLDVYWVVIKLTASPSGSLVKNLSANGRDVGSISGLGRPPGEGNGNPL